MFVREAIEVKVNLIELGLELISRVSSVSSFGFVWRLLLGQIKVQLKIYFVSVLGTPSVSK